MQRRYLAKQTANAWESREHGRIKNVYKTSFLHGRCARCNTRDLVQMEHI
jgi:hypothetical protein